MGSPGQAAGAAPIDAGASASRAGFGPMCVFICILGMDQKPNQTGTRRQPLHLPSEALCHGHKHQLIPARQRGG